MVISLDIWPPAKADPAASDNAAVATTDLVKVIAFSHATRVCKTVSKLRAKRRIHFKLRLLTDALSPKVLKHLMPCNRMATNRCPRGCRAEVVPDPAHCVS